MTKTITRDQAIQHLDNLEAQFPGGKRTANSYRADNLPGAGGVVAMTIYPYRKGWRVANYA